MENKYLFILHQTNERKKQTNQENKTIITTTTMIITISCG